MENLDEIKAVEPPAILEYAKPIQLKRSSCLGDALGVAIRFAIWMALIGIVLTGVFALGSQTFFGSEGPGIAFVLLIYGFGLTLFDFFVILTVVWIRLTTTRRALQPRERLWRFAGLYLGLGAVFFAVAVEMFHFNDNLIIPSIVSFFAWIFLAPFASGFLLLRRQSDFEAISFPTG